MRIRFLAVALLVSATTLVAAPGSSSPPNSVVTTEQDCTEAAYVRGGDSADVRALVPARYELVTNLAGAALMVVNEVTCQRVDRDGEPWGPGPTTTMILSASVSRIDGVAVTGSRYLLSYATSHLPLWLAYQRLGLPAALLDRESGVEVGTLPTGSTSATWTVAGGGWDHTSSIVAAEPTTPVAGTSRLYYEGAQGRLVLTHENHFSQASGRLTGDLSATPFGALSFLSPVLSDVSAIYIRGGWTATLSVVD